MKKDHETNVSELKTKAKEFCEARDWDQFHGAKDLAIGITTEASEILEHFIYKSEEEIEKMFENPQKKEDISDEIADTLFVLLRLAQKYDIDLSESLQRKLEKNEAKYPVEKSRGSNKKYTEY